MYIKRLYYIYYKELALTIKEMQKSRPRRIVGIVPVQI